MSREERYGTRDLTYSRWHRALPDDDLTMIDLDILEYCRRCAAPLLLGELAQDVGQGFKATTVLKALTAEMRNGVKAYLIFYKPDGNGGIERFRVREVYPCQGREAILKPDEWAEKLRELRIKHTCRKAT